MWAVVTSVGEAHRHLSICIQRVFIFEQGSRGPMESNDCGRGDAVACANRRHTETNNVNPNPTYVDNEVLVM
jgi:hypothetical protein